MVKKCGTSFFTLILFQLILNWNTIVCIISGRVQCHISMQELHKPWIFYLHTYYKIPSLLQEFFCIMLELCYHELYKLVVKIIITNVRSFHYVVYNILYCWGVLTVTASDWCTITCSDSTHWDYGFSVLAVTVLIECSAITSWWSLRLVWSRWRWTVFCFQLLFPCGSRFPLHMFCISSFYLVSFYLCKPYNYCSISSIYFCCSKFSNITCII